MQLELCAGTEKISSASKALLWGAELSPQASMVRIAAQIGVSKSPVLRI